MLKISKIIFSLALLLTLASPVSLIFAQPYNPNYVAPSSFLSDTPNNSGTINNTQDILNGTDPRTNTLINNYANNPANNTLNSAPAVSSVKSSGCVGTPKTFKDVIQCTFVNGLLKPIVPLLIGLGVVVFIYGVLVLMFSDGGEKKEEGKQYMLWGIVGIFVMVSVWGLVNIVKQTFNLSENVPKVEIKLK